MCSIGSPVDSQGSLGGSLGVLFFFIWGIYGFPFIISLWAIFPSLELVATLAMGGSLQ